MIGRSSAERRYQLAAQKRHETSLKFDYYNQTAKYFEREYENAKHFNAWNVESYKPIHWEKLKKNESLKLRQEKLREILKKEDEEYQKESDKLKSKRYFNKEASLNELRNKLKENKTEQSFYNPRVYRRLQSYFYPTNSDRSILKEINNSQNVNRPVNILNKMDTDQKDLNSSKVFYRKNSPFPKKLDKKTETLKENQFNSESSRFGFDFESDDESDKVNNGCVGNGKKMNTFDGKNDSAHTLVGTDDCKDNLDESTHSNLDEFNERADHYKTNQCISESSAFGFNFENDNWDNKLNSGCDGDAKEMNLFQHKYHSKESSDDMEEFHGCVRKDFDKNSASAHKNMEEFNERAKSCKLNQSNSESSQFGFNYLNENWDNKLNSGTDLTKHLMKEKHLDYSQAKIFEKKGSIDDNHNDDDDDDVCINSLKYAERYAQRSLENTNIAFGLSNEVPHKQNNKHVAIAAEISTNENIEDDQLNKEKISDTVDIATFENILTKKMSDIDIRKDDKNSGDAVLSKEDDRTEKICQYLTYADLKGKIQDLEKRESRASKKQCWEEALRLKEMRNRLELLKEKQIYQRNDLKIDPDFRKKVLSNIDFRSQQLEKREKLCNNSSMYSEEAKITWDKWMNEDKNFDLIEDYKDKRDVLLKHLEADWQALADDDKKRLSTVYNNVMAGSSLQSELKSLVEKSFH